MRLMQMSNSDWKTTPSSMAIDSSLLLLRASSGRSSVSTRMPSFPQGWWRRQPRRLPRRRPRHLLPRKRERRRRRRRNPPRRPHPRALRLRLRLWISTMTYPKPSCARSVKSWWYVIGSFLQLNLILCCFRMILFWLAMDSREFTNTLF